MKKIISVIALVLAMTMLMSVSAFAAPAFSIAEDATAPAGMTVTPAADSIVVGLSEPTSSAQYSILLVEGNALPVVDNAILYINQATGTEIANFSLLPIIPEAGTELTLYIGSDIEGFGLKSISLVYDEEQAQYTLGDVVVDGEINISDVLLVLNACLGNATLTETQELAANVVVDNEINISDVLLILNVCLGNATL